MALAFRRRLAVPLWMIVFFTVAVTAAPPASLFLIAVLGISVIAFIIGGLVPKLRAARSVVHVVSHRQRHGPPPISMVGGACVRTLDQANTNPAEDTLDLVRIDNGAWQMARPPR
jgi:hypothetical protein